MDSGIDNFIVETSEWMQSDISTLFGSEPVAFISDMDMSKLAVELGAYASTSQARKAGRVGQIPKGWTEWKPNKKMRAWIWNPTE